jgi:hypothetical protein
MALRVFLEKTIGKNCSSVDDGEKVLNLLRPELTKGFSVELDFQGVELVLTPFLNTCFGTLLEQFGRELTMTHVSMKNISDEILPLINNFISCKEKKFTQSNHQKMLQEMFDEDGIADSDL